jgi:hypothetical protein
LIDEYNVKRKKVLADEKRVIELRAAMVQKEDDHEMGLLINKTFEYDKAEAIRINNEQLHAIKVEAEKAADARQVILNAKIAQDEINAENARLANIEYVRGVNNLILNAMIECDIPKYYAQQFIKKIARKELPNLTINY